MTSLGHLFQYPYIKEAFPHVEVDLPVSWFVSDAPFPILGHHCKETCLLFLASTVQLFVCIGKIPDDDPALARGLGFQRSLLTPTMLGFCAKSFKHTIINIDIY